MSLILIDGFEDRSSWVTATGTPGVTIVAGRNGNAMALNGTGTAVGYNLPTADQTDMLSVGFALKSPAVASSGEDVVLSFRSDAGATGHGQLSVDATGALILRTGTGLLTTVITTAANSVTAGLWSYVEMAMKMHDTVGTAAVRVNGGTPIVATGIDSKNGGTKTVYDQVRFHVAVSVKPTLDDLYIRNDVTQHGDAVVQTLYPNGNGAANQWLGSDGNSTDNYALVNETGVPVTTSYVYSTTAGHQDLYTLGDLAALPGGYAVLGVAHAAYLQRTDAALVANAKLLNRRAIVTKSPTITPSVGFDTHIYVLENDPETAAAWTEANVNALQTGIEIA